MKFKIILTMLLTVLLLSVLYGCSMERMGDQLDAAGNAIEERMDVAGNALEEAVQTGNATAAPQSPADTVTKEEAETIALNHAGFTADQVTRLRTEYEIDDGIPRFEVTFRQGRWEYDYEINAETGAILSYDRDD